MDSPVHRLVLLRHAKSDWPTGVADHERPLSERGRRDAPAAGEWLAGAVGGIDVALVSTAVRTRQTWELVSPHLAGCPRVIEEPRVYDATPAELLRVVEGIDEAAGTALVVGHNPGIEDLVLRLAQASASALAERIREKYPTCGIAVLATQGEWSGAGRDAWTLEDFAVPRG